jgi:hypothetical protein
MKKFARIAKTFLWCLNTEKIPRNTAAEVAWLWLQELKLRQIAMNVERNLPTLLAAQTKPNTVRQNATTKLCIKKAV